MEVSVCVVGATGNVGRKVISMLIEKGLVKADKIGAFASQKSAGKIITIAEYNYTIQSSENINFADFDICIFNTESDVSSELVPKALASGKYVVDSSSHFRLDKDVPLIIPPINREQISLEQKLYAHSNCLTSPIATVINPLHKVLPLKRVSVTTYQSTSGAGKRAFDDCWNETKAILNDEQYDRQHFSRRIAFNVIPQVGAIREDGYSYEEYKIIHEVKKVVGQDIAITATSVRVPVLIGHSIALNLEFHDPFKLEDITEILKKAPSVNLNSHHHEYSTPEDVFESDDVAVGRIRADHSIKNGLHMWLCSDNLRRGASTDSVEIVEELIKLLKNQSKG